jgi:dTDP-4-dehydrorhamnose reductase
LRVLITGAKGLVGSALHQYCAAAGDDVLAYDHAGLDISVADEVQRRVRNDRPEAVINCAAWTDVDGCETNPDKAYAVNAFGPENLARASREVEAEFVTISTDYVFDGEKGAPYTQEDTPRPISVYGEAKLEGERRSQSEYARTVIVRTGFIFGTGGRNFLSRVVELAREGQQMFAISDATGTPTYARDLAARLRELALLDRPGIFHVVNAGRGATYEQFCRAALRFAGLDDTLLKVVSMKSLKRPAPRPVDSRLECLLSKAIGLPELPSWEDGLRRFIEEPAAKQRTSPVAHISS